MVGVVARYLPVLAMTEIIVMLGDMVYIRQVRERRSRILDIFAAERSAPEIDALAQALRQRKCNREAKQLLQLNIHRPPAG